MIVYFMNSIMQMIQNVDDDEIGYFLYSIN